MARSLTALVGILALSIHQGLLLGTEAAVDGKHRAIFQVESLEVVARLRTRLPADLELHTVRAILSCSSEKHRHVMRSEIR